MNITYSSLMALLLALPGLAWSGQSAGVNTQSSAAGIDRNVFRESGKAESSPH